MAQTASEKIVELWDYAKSTGDVEKIKIAGNELVEAYRLQVKASLRLEDAIHRMTKRLEGI